MTKSPIEKSVGYRFRDPELLRKALTHKSFSYEMKQKDAHNEKLEFLGDAVIDLVLAELLMEIFPEDDEGSLSKKRASLVNEEALAEMGRRHALTECLLLGKGEARSHGGTKPRLISAAWEALIGAIFLDGGYKVVREILRRDFTLPLENLHPTEAYAADYKTRLQEQTQKVLKATPTYELVSEDGPPHERTFTVTLKVKDQELARGSGRSKKVAEQQAANDALNKWAELNPARGVEV